MSKAYLREKWRNKDYVGLPQWFIDDMVDEENWEKEREREEKVKEYREWQSKQYWPRTKYGL